MKTIHPLLGMRVPPVSPLRDQTGNAVQIYSENGRFWLERATIRLPVEEGNHHIFAYAHDPQGSAATANLPIRVSERITP